MTANSNILQEQQLFRPLIKTMRKHSVLCLLLTRNLSMMHYWSKPLVLLVTYECVILLIASSYRYNWQIKQTIVSRLISKLETQIVLLFFCVMRKYSILSRMKTDNQKDKGINSSCALIESNYTSAVTSVKSEYCLCE